MEKRKMDVGWFTLKLFWETAPQKCILELLLACCKNVLTLINAVWLLHFVMEKIEEGTNFRTLVYALCVLAMLNGLYCALNTWYVVWYKPRKDLATKDKLAQRMMDKAKQLPLKDYENAEFYSIVTRAQKGIESSLFNLFGYMVEMAGFVVGMFSALATIGSLAPWLLMFVFFAPFMLLAAKKQRAFTSDKNKELVKSQRLKSYAQNAWLAKEYAREFKTSDACKIPDKLYDNAYQDSLSIHRKYQNRLFWLHILNRGLSIDLIAIVCYAYAFARICFVGDLSISVFAVSLAAIMNVLSKINKIAKNYAKWGSCESEIRAIWQFMNLEPEAAAKKSLIPDNFESLEFKNVSFSYGETYVLQNVSFKLEAGKKYAIVGYNGAGKTTLAKLIMRLYDVEQGEILYNGINIKQYDLESYRGKIAAVFQDFCIFNLKLSENIFLTEQNGNQDTLPAVLESLNAKELYGYKDNILGREYDPKGIVLSGGQKQKLAVARALCQNAEITIMDEPSAALDPISSDQMMNYIIEKCDGKTLIMVSHQMSVVKEMDKIIMLGQNTLTGFGTHEELLSGNKIYADFYACQADIYSIETNV